MLYFRIFLTQNNLRSLKRISLKMEFSGSTVARNLSWFCENSVKLCIFDWNITVTFYLIWKIFPDFRKNEKKWEILLNKSQNCSWREFYVVSQKHSLLWRILSNLYLDWKIFRDLMEKWTNGKFCLKKWVTTGIPVAGKSV